MKTADDILQYVEELHKQCRKEWGDPFPGKLTTLTVCKMIEEYIKHTGGNNEN